MNTFSDDTVAYIESHFPYETLSRIASSLKITYEDVYNTLREMFKSGEADISCCYEQIDWKLDRSASLRKYRGLYGGSNCPSHIPITFIQPWSTTEICKLKELYTSGFEVSEIAKYLNRTTSSVLGKIHSLKNRRKRA